MKHAVTLAVLALTLLPSLASAACRDDAKESAATCLPGTTFDAATGGCVVNTTS